MSTSEKNILQGNINILVRIISLLPIPKRINNSHVFFPLKKAFSLWTQILTLKIYAQPAQNSEIKRAKNARAEKDDEISELKMQENRLKLVLQNQDKEWKAKYQALEQ